ncbi:unnamed protein product [Rotaria socialis]|uniref:TIR domain-containing protein n=1 Tax=Rotaria socialis TaxID=392032 RepID=A0A818V758_9BILA|nr:unnamed protein product [Rotaria socialis]
MMSYEPGNQSFVHDVYEELKKEHIPVSKNKPLGDMNTFSKRAAEITNSLAICVIMTQAYQASELAEKELGFAHKEKIPLIPCLLTPDWKPTGWLALLTANLEQIVFQSSDPMSRAESMNELVNHIRVTILRVPAFQFPGKTTPFKSHI